MPPATRFLSSRVKPAAIANALFVVSLALPCVLWDDYPEDRMRFGFEILLMGWAGPLAGDFAWYANILFFYVFYRIRRKKPVRARWLVVALLVLASCSVLFPAWHAYSFLLSTSLVVMVGAYVWASSMLFAAYAALASTSDSFKPTS
jgi:hypothetical protein